MKSLIAALLLLAGCGGGQELVVVQVHGDRTGLTQLIVEIDLAGKHDVKNPMLAAGTTDFGVELPEGASGDVHIIVGGKDASGCYVSGGDVHTTANGQDRADVTVVLTPLSPPQC